MMEPASTPTEETARSATGLRAWLTCPAGLSLVAAFVLTRLWLLFAYVPAATDLRIYLRWVTQAAGGRVAFLDFPVEYPPLAWWVMRLPGTLDRLAYSFRFRAMMCAADLASFALLVWVVSRRRASNLTSFALLYIGATLILGHELYDRLDMGVLLFVALATAAWVAALGNHSGSGFATSGGSLWLTGAYAAVGVGTAYKLFPAVLAPFFLLSDLMSGARWRSVLRRAMLCIALAIAPLVVTYSYAGNAAFDFLQYHGERGIEIESSWASLMWLLSLVGYPAAIAIRHTSWELTGDAEQAVLGAASVAMVVLLLGFVAWSVALRRRFDRERAWIHALLAFCGLVVVSKVLTPQYMIWAIPALALAAARIMDTSWKSWLVTTLLLACAALTALVYPAGRHDLSLGEFKTWIMLTLLARNALYAGVWTWLVIRCFSQLSTSQTQAGLMTG